MTCPYMVAGNPQQDGSGRTPRGKLDEIGRSREPACTLCGPILEHSKQQGLVGGAHRGAEAPLEAAWVAEAHA